jgi:hypothetical protein
MTAMLRKQILAPRLADARFEPSAKQLDAVARAATKLAVARHEVAMTALYASIREQAALARATLAHPPTVPKRRARSRD